MSSLDWNINFISLISFELIFKKIYKYNLCIYTVYIPILSAIFPSHLPVAISKSDFHFYLFLISQHCPKAAELTVLDLIKKRQKGLLWLNGFNA